MVFEIFRQERFRTDKVGIGSIMLFSLFKAVGGTATFVGVGRAQLNSVCEPGSGALEKLIAELSAIPTHSHSVKNRICC